MQYKKIIPAFLTATVLATSAPFPVAASTTSTSDTSTQDTATEFETGEYKEGELIVTVKDSTSNKKIENTLEAQGAECESVTDTGDSKTVLATTDDGEEEETAEELENCSVVENVQPNYIYHITDESVTLDEEDLQYHLDTLNVGEAWDTVEDNQQDTTTIAVLDTGVDIGHEDLQSNLVSNTSYTGFLNGVQYTDTEDQYEESHGTHVTGIIGATSSNSLGGTGVASGNDNNLVEILPVGVSDDTGSMTSIDISLAIEYAIEHGADVINMSFGAEYTGRPEDQEFDNVIHTAVKEAYNEGIVCVAAAGNESTDMTTYPSDYDEVISVTACSSSGNACSFTNYGSDKDIAAPGEFIYSTITDSYGYMSGTSMSTPMVSATAALMLDVNPGLTPDEVRDILCSTASGNGSWVSNYLAYGVMDSEAAVEEVADELTTDTSSSSSKPTVATKSVKGKTYHLRVKKRTKHTVKLKWTKTSGARGYEVVLYKNGKKVRVNWTKKHVTTLKKLAKKKKYKVKVRAYYYKSGQKVYMGWSNKVTFKTKK